MKYLLNLVGFFCLALLVIILLTPPVRGNEITASAMWAESGVVVTLSAPLEGSEYHNVWVGPGHSSQIDVQEPEQLSENSWLVPWDEGIIGGVLCTENSCTIFTTEWSVATRYLWLKIIVTLIVAFLIARFVARWFAYRPQILVSVDTIGG